MNNRVLNVLVACEESQTVCKAFRALGHEAYSCDIEPPSGGRPEWHLQMDALEALKWKKWDLLIAHPPCTFLSNAGADRLFPESGYLDEARYENGLKAKAFFMEFLRADVPFICVENPTPSKIFGLPPHTQAIQPYEYGHPYTKRTLLWLKGLPKLTPTKCIEEEDVVSFNTKVRGSKNRSKTFVGIAEAMATQWSKFILENYETV